MWECVCFTISYCRKFQDIQIFQPYTKEERIVPCIPKDPTSNYDNNQFMDDIVSLVPLHNPPHTWAIFRQIP